MSDELASDSFELEIDGKILQCGHVTASDRAALREHIRRERIRAVQEQCKGYNADMLSKTIARTVAQSVSDAELYAIMGTEEGMQFLLWCGLRRMPGQEHWTLEHVRKVLEPELLMMYATRQYQQSGFLNTESEIDPNVVASLPDYDKHMAMIVRYYGLGLDDVKSLSPKQIQLWIGLIPKIAKELGEASGT